MIRAGDALRRVSEGLDGLCVALELDALAIGLGRAERRRLVRDARIWATGLVAEGVELDQVEFRLYSEGPGRARLVMGVVEDFAAWDAETAGRLA